MDQDRKKKLIDSFLTRGVENIIPNGEALEKALYSGKVLNVYLGIDPTATKIHLGHAFPLRKLQILSELGHHVTFLIGDFTALVGDTSDKDTERPVLTKEQIEENFKDYKRQAEKLLDFSKVELHYNSEWLSKLTFFDVIKLCGHFSLNDFISRELIKKRLSEGKRVSLPETLYPIMQGYDSYNMDTDIQLGGTDQTFNMQAGRTLLKDLKNKDSFIVANGFLSGTDGRKMSKTWGNAIWLEDSPEEIFGKVMSISDDVIISYYTMGTNADVDVIEDAKKRLASGENPMNIKRELARRIVSELSGEDKVANAEDYFQKTVVEKSVTEEAVEVKWKEENIEVEELIKILIDKGFAASNGEVKRLIEQGGLYINGERVSKDKHLYAVGEGVVRFGKRKYLRLIG
ncbi:MAG TPA: tyrosine--tRNA ligase [Patescibacteria group bacterium]